MSAREQRGAHTLIVSSPRSSDAAVTSTYIAPASVAAILARWLTWIFVRHACEYGWASEPSAIAARAARALVAGAMKRLQRGMGREGPTTIVDAPDRTWKSVWLRFRTRKSSCASEAWEQHQEQRLIFDFVSAAARAEYDL